MNSDVIGIINTELHRLDIKNIRAVGIAKVYPCDSCVLDMKVCNGMMATKCADSIDRSSNKGSNICFIGNLQGYDEYTLSAQIAHIFSLIGNIRRAHE